MKRRSFFQAVAKAAAIVALAPQIAFRVKPEAIAVKMPEVLAYELTITSIEAGVKKLDAHWSCEVEQDIQAFFGPGVEDQIRERLKANGISLSSRPAPRARRGLRRRVPE